MEEKREYLNEESYQKAKRKIVKISLIILVIGLIIGGSFIITGAVKQNNAKKTTEIRKAEALKEAEAKAKKADEAAKATTEKNQKRLEEINLEINHLKSKKEEAQVTRDQLNMRDSNWLSESNKYLREINDLTKEIDNLEKEADTLKPNQNEDEFDVFDDFMNNAMVNVVPIISEARLSASSIFFYYFGAVIIIATFIISGLFYLIANRREISAFAIQQTMPVKQEVIEKMAPTIGNAAGSIAEGVTKGIKEGLKEKDTK